MNIQERLYNLRFFPYKKISEVPKLEIQAELIYIFKIYGKPSCIKVDNGRPFGDPQSQIIPPLALWLIGMGIKMIWNRPATPQDNAKVERSQGVMGRWTEYPKCKSTLDLQFRLWKEAEFHNLDFPIRRQGNKKRIELFPKLHHTGKCWSPKDFKLDRVLNFLAKGYWERKASKHGQVALFGRRYSISSEFEYQKVSIRLDKKLNCWNIFDLNGKLIKQIPSPFTTKGIWNLDFS